MDKFVLPAAHIHFQQPEKEVSDLCTQNDTAVWSCQCTTAVASPCCCCECNWLDSAFAWKWTLCLDKSCLMRSFTRQNRYTGSFCVLKYLNQNYFMHMYDYTDSYTLSYKNSFPKLMHQNYRILLLVSVAQNSIALDDGMFSKQELHTVLVETVTADLRYNPGTHL